MVNKALDQALLASAEVTGLVGDRIYPLVSDLGEDLPAIAYMLLSQSEVTIYGDGEPVNYGLLQVHLFATNYNEVHELAEEVIATLRGYETVINGYKTGFVSLEDKLDKGLDREYFGTEDVFEVVLRFRFFTTKINGG